MSDIFDMKHQSRVANYEEADQLLDHELKKPASDIDHDLIADCFARMEPGPDTRPNFIGQDPFRWVASATVGPEDPRYKLRYVQSDGYRLMATNGVRVHIAHQSGWQPGYHLIGDVHHRVEPPHMTYPALDTMVHEPEWHTTYRIQEARMVLNNQISARPSMMHIDMPDVVSFSPIEVDHWELQQSLLGFDGNDRLLVVPGDCQQPPIVQFSRQTRIALLIGMSSQKQNEAI